MNTQGYTSLRASENVTLDQANDIMAQVQTQHLDGGKLLALFGNQVGIGADYMTPVTDKQANGSAMWVGTGPSLTDQGIDPANDRVYFQLWIEAKQGYRCVGDIIREMANNGNNLALAIE